MSTPRYYTDDETVRDMTLHCMSLGHRLFQIHKLDRDDCAHIARLLTFFDLPLGARVLDAGCGIGEVARLMAQLRQDLRFVLLNISQAQLDLCPAHFEKLCADFHAIPLPDTCMDGVMINYALGHGEPEQVLRETYRVLKSGGRLLIYDITAPDPQRLHKLLDYRPYPLEMVSAAAQAAGFVAQRAEVLCGTTSAHMLNLMDAADLDNLMQGVEPIVMVCVKP